MSLIVHGHFYQPPRENPWNGEIDRETSAHPYPNWNARIHAESYARNRAVTLPSPDHPDGTADNYRSLSFDFGPTLLDWMVGADPETVQALRDADAAAVRETGHGRALAHGYNHAILPLLTPRNRRTQIRWGLAHFRHVFGRDAEGFWLPEAAFDDASLDALALEGVQFTILAPGQLAAVRTRSEAAWRPEIHAADLGRAYRYRTRAGREMALVFYDGAASGEMAFGPLLQDGRALADRLRRGLSERTPEAPLFCVALDGETFGHHHRAGAEALALAFAVLRKEGVEVTHLGGFLASHPPRAEALLREPGSWSCAHGVERWRDHCGCTTGGEPGWTQAWRRPLFEAVRALDAELASVFEQSGASVFRDPWAARDRYIELLLPGGTTKPREFFASVTVPKADTQAARALLEMERYALLMFTSCGWFFDDPARLETRQVLRYAARALEHCPEPPGDRLRARFTENLTPLRSNKDPSLDGSRLFEDVVGTSRSGARGTVRYEDDPDGGRP